MKKLILAVVIVAASLNVWAQGQLNFLNRVTADGIDAPIYAPNGTTKLDSTYFADLFYGPVGAATDALTSLGLQVAFRAGAAAGYIPTTVVTVPGYFAGQQVQVQLRAWNAAGGATWALASTVPGNFVSPVTAPSINVTLTTAPNPPASMIGLTSHNLTVVPVPEPSTILLGLAGIGGLLFIRRKTA